MNRIVLFEVNGNRNAKVKYPVFAWMEALAFYLVFNLRGPKTAPRAHMGRPVWAASNHFTATSPANRKGGSSLTVEGTQNVSQASKWMQGNNLQLWLTQHVGGHAQQRVQQIMNLSVSLHDIG